MIFQTIYDRPPDGRTIPGPVSLAAAGQASQPGGIGGFLSRLGHRFMAPNDYGPNLGAKLTRFGAELQDINDGGNRAAAIHQRMEAERQQQAEAARRQQLSELFRGSFRPDGSFDGQAFAASASQSGLVNSIEDISALQRFGVDRKFERVGEDIIAWDANDPASRPEVFYDGPDEVRRPKIYNGDINQDGVPDLALEDDVYELLGWRPPGAQPAATSDPPPPAGFRPVRPTEAPAVVGAAPRGFKDRADLQAFVRDQAPSARFTSGYRSQAEQDALVRRGATRATRSAHTYGMGQDFVLDGIPRDQWEGIAERLRASGRFKRVIVESGGPGQGTAPHIHLEPR